MQLFAVRLYRTFCFNPVENVEPNGGGDFWGLYSLFIAPQQTSFVLATV